jgi:hypothetical protein
MSLATPVSVQKLQTALHAKAVLQGPGVNGSWEPIGGLAISAENKAGTGSDSNLVSVPSGRR